MDCGEMELPSKTECIEVWGDGGNGEDSGVEVLRAASCGSSVLSGYSEAEAASECGSDTYTSNTVKTLAAQLTQQLDLNETLSESSSTQDGPTVERSRSLRTKKPSVAECRGRVTTRSEAKPKIPAKPANIKPSPRTKKVEPAKAKGNDNDGRWPFSVHKPRSRATSAADPGRKSGPASLNILTSTPISKPMPIHSKNVSASSNLMSSSFGPSSMHKSMTQSFGGGGFSDESMSALEKYGTLPRRKKKGTPDKSPAGTRSNSREPSLNRAATLRRQTSKEKDETISSKSLPPYPRGRRPPVPKTIIFHETGVQTSLTGRDLDSTTPRKGSGNVRDNHAQTEFFEGNGKCSKDNRIALERIQRLLGVESARELNMSLLDDLEQHVTTMTRTVIKQREELSEINNLKNIAQSELERNVSVQKNILQQQKDAELENVELQEFLQAEKNALTESLDEAENEIVRLKNELELKNGELSEQQDQCKHLVRLCEQRRQENLGLEARLAGLEQRSHDVLRQQGAAVSGAAVALTSLGARLDNLVDQLAVSYNVADKDLEDVIFHNEAYSPGQSPDLSEEAPREAILETKKPRRTSSFLNAVLSAIRSTTQSPSAVSLKLNSNSATPPENSDSLGLLDTDLTLDQFSKSSESGEDSVNNGVASASLHNLSAAILQRQKNEEEEEVYRSMDAMLPPDLNSLVDQVIQVDNLVTKLLKVMRIVQMDNETCLDRIVDQRTDLDERLRLETTIRQESDIRLSQVENELQEARMQLNARIQQLEDAKTLLADTWRRESERQYATIDHALETLQNMQDVVDQFPPLLKLQQQLEDCNFRTASGDDLNANSPNGHVDNSEVNGATVRSTAI